MEVRKVGGETSCVCQGSDRPHSCGDVWVVAAQHTRAARH
jgi:hypothetical protein